ncbi:MAG TPA: cytochrome b/b6 domain-containing protein [Steroidobacteraceae bacterium]|nr:cytochrome b/b6 domain-containing protein [Steroidobacteraceae bacterium]
MNAAAPANPADTLGADQSAGPAGTPEADRAAGSPRRADLVRRHAGIDRLYHWLTAACVLVLLATGLLPHAGIAFDWVNLHWTTGIVLIALTLFHLLRSLIWKQVRTIWFTVAQLRGQQVGKYSVAQKLMHHAMGVMVLCAVVTGALLLKKISTPLLVRDPYLFGAGTWGIIYAVHGLAAVSAVTLVMVHVYFALRPENRMYLLAMLTGRMSRADQRERVRGIRAGETHLT